ncbi:MAG: leucine-rich repeat protein [Oscillospiraceae bacterium]|nr:leucine-rich repeat protein [Oscillospiraceae bacterium]
MKKFTSRYIAILMAGFLMCSSAELLPNQISTSLTAHAYDMVNGTDGLQYHVYDDYAVVVKATEEKIWVVIPDEFQKEDGTVVPVTEIASRAFEGEKTITDLILGANVIRIGAAAFANCTNLATATFNEGLEEIGQQAFDGCGFEEITLPTTLKEIFWAFPNSPNLRSVNFLGGNELVIRNSSFALCKALETVTMGDGVAEIGENCFTQCSNLKTVQLSPTLKTLGAYAFRGCALEQVKIPDSVETIGEYAFSQCNLTKVTLHEGLKIIKADAFYSNTSLTEITIPSTVEEIGSDTFQDNKNLESITFLGMNTVLYSLRLPETTLIRGYEGSTAQAYAEKNGNSFEIISSNLEPEPPTDTIEILLGDVNDDKKINAEDASNILIAAALIGAGNDSGLTSEQIKSADVNHDDSVNASDASLVLAYAAYIGAGGNISSEEYFASAE